LTLLGALVPRACPASNITTAALFRAVEKWQPTPLIDEADTFLLEQRRTAWRPK
jgi:putative DNA primase/helicase